MNAEHSSTDQQTQRIASHPLRVLFAGGGTGGHLSPALAIAQTLRQRHPDAAILFIGTADRIEASKVPAAGFDFRAISVHGLAGRWSLSGLAKRLRGVGEIVSGLPIWQALAIIGQFQPDVVIGTGGYVCGPVLAAAKLTGRSAILVEQNEEIGYTSRLVSRFIKLAAVISDDSGAFFRVKGIRTEAVGNPVRPAIIKTTRQEGIAALSLDTDRLTISIIGGSLGSTPVNEAAIGALRQLATESWFHDGWQVIHVVGPQRGGGMSPDEAKTLGISYSAYSFLDNIHDVLAASDVIITRGGGTFLAEIAARGIPMIIIPWSGAANDHQTRNAQPFTKAGAAIAITDAELSPIRLLTELHAILPDPSKRSAMATACRALGRPESSDRIVTFIEEFAGARNQRR
ncbi:MAG: UDP-N-acetylglucosamine--N-acetylmuramyl-(pentapeptide) pyrophosphoryl-undecaprenol N-acetylglucosamine transferase [Gammaproteobacteria bacterium]|nr:UDP-N-acetylglucosamine--N-acetylmuramyl-(pentapeptide) pyrophosphoryl-undecaprenol N-acetylglucosamine transferase [Gammaproteobacteria bacterium]